jgi:hypothetical protein
MHWEPENQAAHSPSPSDCKHSVGITFSGSNHYTSAGIVVRTTKSNSNIKEAKVQEVHSSNPAEVVKPKVVIPLRL